MTEGEQPFVRPDVPFDRWESHARDVTQPVPDLPIFDVADFEGQAVPPRKWHVDGLIPGENVTLFMADGAVGKSTLAARSAAPPFWGSLGSAFHVLKARSSSLAPRMTSLNSTGASKPFVNRLVSATQTYAG